MLKLKHMNNSVKIPKFSSNLPFKASFVVTWYVRKAKLKKWRKIEFR